MLEFSNGDRFAVFRLPGRKETVLYRSASNGPVELDAQDFHRDGYVVMPFRKEEKSYFIPADEQYINPLWRFFPSSEQRIRTMEKIDYLKMINAGIELLSSEFPKVILSRPLLVPAPPENTNVYYRRLCEYYPDAFVFFWHTPETGTWMGASPEPLIRELDSGRLETVALAGTRPWIKSNFTAWKEKEIEEQQLVVDYIGGILEGAVEGLKVGKAHTVHAGSVEHIQTRFSYNRMDYLYKLVNLLHPTPAVCGLPPMEAYRTISSLEPYDRSYYTGCSGPVGKEIHLYVTLRCMQMLKKEALIYVGGGITSASIPEKEWDETQWKARTLLSVL